MDSNLKIEKRRFRTGQCTDLAEEWDSLLARSSRPTVYSTFDCFDTVNEHFYEDDEEVYILLFREAESDALVAIFSYCIEKESLYGIETQVLYHGIVPDDPGVDKPYPIIEKDREEECWNRYCRYLKREFTDWDRLTYDEFTPESYFFRNLRSLFSFPGYWCKSVEGPESPIMDLNGDWEEFWMSHRKLRKKTRRLEKKMGDRLNYSIISDPDKISMCLDAYVETELLSWKAGKEGISPEDYQPFYRDLFVRLAEKGRIYFGILREEEKVVSLEVAYTFGDRVYFAHGTYDPAYSDISPGTVNSGWFIKFFHGKGYVEGDYLAGYASYNNPWAARIEKTVTINVRRLGWKNWRLAACHLTKKLKNKLSSADVDSGSEGG